MDKDIDKFRNKIPDPPSKIPFVYIGDVNIEEELKKIFGDEKVLSPQNIERIKSYSLSLRDFLTNIKTILFTNYLRNPLSPLGVMLLYNPSDLNCFFFCEDPPSKCIRIF